VPKFRLGIVAYRDRGDAYVVEKSPLTPHHWEAVKWLNALEPGGGGDTPEAVFAALRDAIRNYAWAPKGTRILVLVGDAPPHPEELSEVESTARAFSKDRGLVHTITCSVVSNGPDLRAVRSAFDKIATAGRGRSLDLSQGESLAQALLPFVFGDEYVEDMRLAVDEVSRGLRARVARRLAEEGTPREVDAELRRRAAAPRVPRGPRAGPAPRSPRRLHRCDRGPEGAARLAFGRRPPSPCARCGPRERPRRRFRPSKP
jgi:hypothetical protein